MDVRRALATVQGAYFAATGAWALVDVDSFMAVTGPKTDVWLVKTVAVLVIAIGGALLVAAWRREVGGAVALLAVASAAGLAGIDVVYATRGVISEIYLLDAAAEVALVLAWAGAWALGQGSYPKPLERERVPGRPPA